MLNIHHSRNIEIQQIKASLTQEGQYNHKSCQNHCALGEFLYFFKEGFLGENLEPTRHTDPLFFHTARVQVMIRHPVDPTATIPTPDTSALAETAPREPAGVSDATRRLWTISDKSRHKSCRTQINKKKKTSMQLWSVQLHEGEFNLNRPSRPLLRTGSARNFQHLEQKQKSTSTSGRCEDKTAPFWSGPLSSLMNNWEGSRCNAWGRDVTRLCAQ